MDLTSIYPFIASSDNLRKRYLQGAELAQAQFDTIRLRVLRIGARTEVKKRLIRFHLPESYPLTPALSTVVNALTPAFQT